MQNIMSTEKEINNPIHKDKITETPSLLPYAHTVGGAIIRPLDQGRTKGLAMQAMYEQTDVQLNQIRKQVELLISQAQEIHDRIGISESIYQAECRFKPNIGHTYHLYTNKDGNKVLSMIGPEEWGKNAPMQFEASVRLLADHTWDVVAKAPKGE
jgi:hypothetical protein